MTGRLTVVSKSGELLARKLSGRLGTANTVGHTLIGPMSRRHCEDDRGKLGPPSNLWIIPRRGGDP